MISDKFATFTACFFKELNIGDIHGAVNGFQHIINGEQSDLDGDESFHFDAGFSGGRSGDETFQGVFILEGVERNGDRFKREYVTKRDYFGSFFSGGDGGDSSGGKDIAFRDIIIMEHLKGLRRHDNTS